MSSPAQEKSPGRKPKERLSIPVTDAGAVDVATMKPENLERLRKALQAEGVAAALGADLPRGAASADVVEPIPPGLVAILYSAVSTVLVQVARRSGMPEAQAAQLSLTADEIEILTAPTCKVLDKYLPSGLSRYGDELALGIAVLTVAQTKIAVWKGAAPITMAPTRQDVSADTENVRTERAAAVN